MVNNLDSIVNDDYSELKDHNIDVEPKYGKVVIENIPKDSVIIINGEDIQIIKKNKYVRVDENLDIECKGDITIIHGDGERTNLEGLLSYEKLVQALSSSLGNFGGLIQFPTTLQESILTYKDIKLNKDK